MKKILSLILVALTLCVQHESHAMANLRNYAGRIGQQCTRLYTQGAQRVAPAYRSFTTGLGQRVSNIRPQTSQLFRNMQSSARNWSQNLPTKQQVARTLGLATAGSGAIVSGAGLGIYGTHKYLKAKNVVHAEENEAPDVINYLEKLVEDTAKNPGHYDWSANQFFDIARVYEKYHDDKIDPAIRQKFISLANNLINIAHENKDLTEELLDDIKREENYNHWNYNKEQHIKQEVMSSFRKAAEAIWLVNAWNFHKVDLQKIEIPDVYKKFFRDISNNNELKTEFLKVINDVRKEPNGILDRESRRYMYLTGENLTQEEIIMTQANLNRLFDTISKEVQGTSSLWSYFGY